MFIWSSLLQDRRIKFVLSCLRPILGYINIQTFSMKKGHQIENTNVSSFILKLSRLLEDPRIRNIVTWSLEGDSILIDSHNEMLESILSKYFNHTKISSFVRQLNLYGFKKISERGSQMMYKHPYFIRDKINMHKLIKRKRKTKTCPQQIDCVKSVVQNPILEKQKMKVKGLQDIYFRIKKQNQKITNQISLVKNHVTTLAQSRDSSFLMTLKTSFAENSTKSEQNSRQQNQPKSNDQQSTPQTDMAQLNHFRQQENDNLYYMNGDNQDSQRNDDANSEMDILKQNNDEISNKKMYKKDNRYANFWQDEEVEMNSEEYE